MDLVFLQIRKLNGGMEMKIAIINGKIRTMDPIHPEVEAMLIEGEKIIKVGRKKEIESLINEADEIIDLNGSCVIPGFNDSHQHLLGYGISRQRVALHGAQSISELIHLTTVFLKEKKLEKGKWIVGRGWNQDQFKTERRFPTRYDLDEVSTEHPILLFRRCGHVAVANSEALRIAGLLNHSDLEVVGGSIECDEAGQVTGVLTENAITLISSLIPPYSDEELKSILKESMEDANAKGITSIQSDDFEMMRSSGVDKIIKLYESLAEAGEMTCRIYEQCLLPTKEELVAFLETGYKTGDGTSFFKIGPLKLLCDGSLGGRTAAMRQPYFDQSNTSGILCYSQEELDEMVTLAHEAKMQVAIHAIGDLAIENALNSIESLQCDQNHRHGIVHCQITDDGLLERFAKLNVLAYIQPIFLNSDIPIVNHRVGEALSQTSYAFKTMLNKGIHVALGTDCPVESLDPFANLYCAITRQDLSGQPESGWNIREALTLEEAIYNYTMGSAYASFEESVKGSLSVGKFADFIVLNQDIFKIPPIDLLKTKVLQTFVNGRCVYQAS